MFERLKIWLCRHGFYYEDIRRVNDDLVHGICHKCGCVREAPYGLALPGTLDGHRPLPSTVGNQHE